MSVFEKYSSYYDLLYKDKDYAGEAKFVLARIAQHMSNAFSILEFGCGTGTHARLFATAGLEVHGIDYSDEMLRIARQGSSELPSAVNGRLSFARGDIRNYRADKLFDVVTALFHVVSYQTSNEDLIASMRTAKEHLKDGGIFLFDYWFGPAVLALRPDIRVKRMESDDIRVTRIAEPLMNCNTSCVNVNYTLFVEDKRTRATEQFTENHMMRYLFPMEVELLAQAIGMRVLESFEWMTGKSPDLSTWGVCTVLGQ